MVASAVRKLSLVSWAKLNLSLEILGHRQDGYHEIETILYRISQESLTNVIRHAQAKQVSINLTHQDGTLSLRIEDDGIGFDPDDPDLQDGRQRLGLLGMQERVDGLGGTLALYSAPGQGTTLHITLPVPEEFVQ